MLKLRVMRGHRIRPGIIVLAPSQAAQGGISTVISNYARTSFWQEFRVRHLPTTDDVDSRWIKGIRDCCRLAAFAPRLIVGGRPGAISVHMAHDSSFYRKLAYMLVAAVFRIPIVLHIHPASFSTFYWSGGRFRKLAVRLAGRLSDQSIFLSEETRSQLAEVFPLARSSVLRNPVDVDAYATGRERITPSRPRVLFLGWIVPEKGVYDIVEAIPEVLRSFPDVLFTFGGNKEVDKLRAEIASRGLSDSAEVLGWVEMEQKLHLLRSSRVLILPSYNEGLPNVILEAMASRLPIITTPVGGIPSVLRHDETAIFVDPGSVSTIAAAVKALLADDNKRLSLADAAFDLVSKEYSLQAVSTGLCRIYDRYRVRSSLQA